MADSRGFKPVAKYAGVFAKELRGKMAGEVLYYIRFRGPDGVARNEKVGYKLKDKLTPALVAGIRADKIKGEKLPKTVVRAAEKAKEERLTMKKLWESYDAEKPNRPGRAADKSRWKKYLLPTVADMEIHEVDNFTIDRVKKAARITKKVIDKAEIEIVHSEQSVKHVLTLLRILINYGINEKSIAPVKIAWKKKMPKFDNRKTEYLTDVQMGKLLDVLQPDIAEGKPVAGMMYLAVHTGMRLRELLELEWSRVDLDHGVLLVKNPKEKLPKHIQLSGAARAFFESWPKRGERVFCRPDGEPYSTVARTLRRYRDKAGLPKDFRPTHGLRHSWATTAVSSGVPLAVVGEMLGHREARTTSRYAHIRNDALRLAAETVAKAVAEAVKKEES
jgi:integrase